LTLQFTAAYNSKLCSEKGIAMNDDITKDLFSSRKFLESSSAAIATAGMLAADANAQGEKQPYPSNDERKPYPTRDDRSASAPGPGNPELDAQNPVSTRTSPYPNGSPTPRPTWSSPTWA
jgi:hypothetical protein